MGRIEKRFEELKKENRKALVLFLSAGDPDLKTTEELIPEIFNAGADIIEIGIPFSDPLADGPIIQASFVNALKGGVTPKKIMAMTHRLRRKTEKPIMFMSAYNLVFSYGKNGIVSFVNDARKAGLDGLILPDVIPEEAGDILPLLRKSGIDSVFLAAPTSGLKRIKKIAASSAGFLYYIAVKGVTGKQKSSPAEVKKQISLIRTVTDLPVCCGFGISNPKEAAAMSRIADGVIIGSALVKIIADAKNRTARIRNVVDFVKSVRRAMDDVRS